MLLGILLFQFSGCSKEEDDDQNPTNGKTTAVFNPDKTYGSMTDQDGNTYKTITIGPQTWMAENLRTTKYNEGTLIPNIIEVSQWYYLSNGAYCNYNNSVNIDTIATFGRLYNWYAVNTGKLCPIGWHVPNSEEFLELTDYLGGLNIAGGKLKETGTTHWTSPNFGTTNESGFTALPGGYRHRPGKYEGIGNQGFWWSTAVSSETDADYRMLSSASEGFPHSDTDKELGLSVRCLKD